METTAARFAAIENLLVEPSTADDTGFRLTCLGAFDPTSAAGDGPAAAAAAAAELAAMVADLWPKFGRPRTVAMDGFLDPRLELHAGPALSEALAGVAVEMYGWQVGERWLGVGLVKGPEAEPLRLVAVASTSTGAEPAQAKLSPTEWAEKLISVAGRGETRRTVDWESVEKRLGLPLPADYKLLVEHFGAGAFDGSVVLRAPDSPTGHLDLISEAVKLAALLDSLPECREVYHPFPVHPAPKGLLQWGATSAEHEFHWLTESPDPDGWPILARMDSADSWKRFDCSVSEFVCRTLTDSGHRYSIADRFETHWFDSCERSEGCDPLRGDE
ncbi:SMI1/KNR4 family protein [Kitasatospora terrestris]|uniref:Knr4/Smi1-like domain-containing protein n=1 Tax=Kitasatospora terrestris TaxID=258051 RepID=A0ABP9DBB9_9ACTN